MNILNDCNKQNKKYKINKNFVCSQCIIILHRLTFFQQKKENDYQTAICKSIYLIEAYNY